jgi:hypothetical protein
MGAFGAVIVVAVAIGDDRSSALERDPQGWSDLLANAGSDLKGWTRGPIPPTGKLSPRSQWSLDPKTGYLICEGNGGHEWLRWDQEQGDFIYHVEWRFSRVAGKSRYNSGVYVRNSADAKIWIQAQTGDGSGGFLFGDVPAGERIERIDLAKQADQKRVRPAGEWNTYEITCKGKDIGLWTNGAVTCEWHDCPVLKGYVGLEAEGYRIEFRNIKLKAL